MKTISTRCALCAALALAFAASAGTPEVTASPKTLDVRPFLFHDGAEVAGAMQVIGSSRLTFSPAGGDGWLSRKSPLSEGAALETSTELGLGHSLSIELSGLRGDRAAGTSGGRLGLRWSPVAQGRTRVLFTGGVVQQLAGAGSPTGSSASSGAFGSVAVEQGLGIVRFSSSLQARKSFASGSDALDVSISAGADASLGRNVRVGVEYAGQDLEEESVAGSEGGANHVIGAVASVRALDDKLAFSIGPALALGAATPRPLGRVALLWSF